MSVDIILREASTVLQAAKRYKSELTEAGLTNSHLHQMSVLITRVAAHSYTAFENNHNVATELHELQDVKNTILSTAIQRFGSEGTELHDFRYRRETTIRN